MIKIEKMNLDQRNIPLYDSFVDGTSKNLDATVITGLSAINKSDSVSPKLLYQIDNTEYGLTAFIP